MITFKSTRKPWVAALAGLTVFSWLIADSQTSDAQLFRRLRERIQIRIPAPQIQVPQIPNNQLQRPLQPNVPQYNQQRRQADPKNGLDPRRVAPVDPAEPRAVGAAKIDADPRLAPGTSDSPSRRTSPGSEAPNADQDSFGSSILPKPNAKPSGVGQRKPAIGGSAQATSSELAQQERASLGIQVVESRQGIPGLIVTGINVGSHAPSAGLKVGDLIVSIDGQPTESVAGIANLLTRRNVGENVQMRIVRNRSTSSIDIRLMGGPLKTDSPRQPTGDAITDSANLEPANDQLTKPAILGLSYVNIDGQRGALITDIQENSPASASGLETGDRIVAVDGRLLINAEALQQTLDTRKDDSAIGVRVVRKGKLLSAKIDPLAKPTSTGALAASDSAPADGSKQSVLGGVGAIFGELFGGKSNSMPNDEPALDDGSASEEMARDEMARDEMALGDEEGVQQVAFESDTAAEKKVESTDPRSLEALEPPPIGEENSVELLPPAQAKKKSPEELQKEINELRKQIKALQEKK